MRAFIAILALLPLSAFADTRVDAVMAPCPLLDADYQQVDGITNSTRLDIAQRKLRDDDSQPDGIYHWVCDYKLTKYNSVIVPPPIEPDPNEPVEPPPVDCDITPDDPSCPPVEPPVEPPVDPEPGLPPIAVDDHYTGKWGNVLDNDTGDTTARNAREFTSGTVNLKPDGTFTIVDDSGACGPGSFKYRAKSREGLYSEFATVTVSDICAGPDVVDPVEPTPDPNEPAEPVDPNNPADCVVPNCPELAMPYSPEFPPIGQYSVSGVCEAIHNNTATRVTMRSGEALADALTRLQAANPLGGVLEIPWDIDTIQCDSSSLNHKNYMPSLTISGVTGPNGEQPRFYCRSTKRDGTIVKGLPGSWFGAASKKVLDENGHMKPMNIVIENVHIDGYGGWVTHPQSGKQVIRNSYFHSTPGDGFTVTGLDLGDEKYASEGIDIQFCGNEISHGGQGNAKHCFYEHRSQLPGIDYKFTLVDNTIHSCNGSSGFKSIGNENFIAGNKFLKSKDTPTLSKRYTQVQVDVVSCSKTTIKDNLFHSDLEQGAITNVMIDFVQRRGLQGCDEPRPGPYDGRADTPSPVLGNPFWTERYWADLNGERPFTSHVKNNAFVFLNWRAERQTAIRWRGTYPGYTYTLGGGTCLLQAPQWWYERSEVIAEGNSYNQANDGDLYETDPPRAGYVFGDPWQCNGVDMPPIMPPDPRVFAPITTINEQYEVSP